MEFPIIESERIILKKLTHENSADVYEHFSNEEINKFVDFDTIKTIEEAKEIIDWGISLFQKNIGMLWGIFRKADSLFLGQINYVKRKDDNYAQQVHRAEIGFDLSPNFWGKGYMSEAINAANAYVFSKMGINRVEAIVHPLNIQAHKTLEKTGFKREGLLRQYVLHNNDFWDMVIFSLLKNDPR